MKNDTLINKKKPKLSLWLVWSSTENLFAWKHCGIEVRRVVWTPRGGANLKLFYPRGEDERHWDSQETSGSSCLAVIMIKIWSPETAPTGTQTGHGILIRAQLTEVAVCTTQLKIKAPFDLYIFNVRVTLSFALVDWMIQSSWVESGSTRKVKASSRQPGPSADNLHKLLPWHPPSLTQIKSSTLSSLSQERLIHIYRMWSCNRSSRGQRDGSEEPLKRRKIRWNLAPECSSCRYADAVWISRPHIKSVCWWFSV